jgi:gluconolactonase
MNDEMAAFEARLASAMDSMAERRRVKSARVEIVDPAIEHLIPRDVHVECIASGFTNCEGPVWMGDHLLFTDAPANRIICWRPLPSGPEVTTWRFPAGWPLDRPAWWTQPGANGMTRDRQGRLIACEDGNRRVTRTESNGLITVLADRYQGRRLNIPNDVVVRSDGQVYFTDPHFMEFPPAEPRELDIQGVYRVDLTGEVQLVVGDFSLPNGLAFSPDERTLYVDDSRHHHIRAFDVGGDGSVSNGRVFAKLPPGPGEAGVPDGMKVDREGNVYCCGAGGLWVFDPSGRHLGRLVLPDWPRNIGWGDDDWRTAFVTAGTSVYRFRVGVAGIPV